MDKQDSKTVSLREAATMAPEALSLHHTDKEYSEERLQARYALRVALALPDEPVVKFQCEPQPAVTDDGFCEWVCPVPTGYLMQCCDCGLIHEVETRVALYESRPSEEFILVDNPDLQVQLRMKRRDDLAPQPAEPKADASAVPGPAGWVDARNWTRADWKAYADANWDMGAPPSAPVERKPLSSEAVFDLALDEIAHTTDVVDLAFNLIRATEATHDIKGAA